MAIPIRRYGVRAIVLCGLAAGASLVAFEVIANIWIKGVDAAGEPLQAVAALVTSGQVVDSRSARMGADAIGIAVDLGLAVVFAGLFATFASWIARSTEGELLANWAGLVPAGAVFGMVLWMAGIYLVRFEGWTWLPNPLDRDVALLAYVFFFGAPLGWMLDHFGAAAPTAA